MARTITINFARLTATPTVGFDMTTGQGKISASYVVGERKQLPGPNDEAGNPTTVDFYVEHPTAAASGSAQLSLGPTDVAGTKMQELIATIAAQEGLDLTAGDEVLTS
jgi:hypothetical protein